MSHLHPLVCREEEVNSVNLATDDNESLFIEPLSAESPPKSQRGNLTTDAEDSTLAKGRVKDDSVCATPVAAEGVVWV